MSTVLVTGASSGIGRALSLALVARGHRVLATMRRATERADLLPSTGEGGALVALSLDVTREDEREAIAARASEFGIDAVVNNAGFGLFGALEDLTEEQLRRQLEVNFFGTALLTRALLPTLRRTKGVIVNLSSVLGYAGFPLTSAYCASKYAVEGLSEALYFELAPHGVRVHLVEPGGHRTAFGANVEWGAGRETAYSAQTAGYRAMQERLLARPGTPPDGVVRAIVDLVERPSARLRVRVGRDASGMHALRKLLPEGAFVATLGLAYRRLLGRARAADAVGEGAEATS